MPDAQDPLEDAPDPTEDTPDDDSEDTAEADDSSQSDWTPKDRGEATRKITELAQENARLKREAAAAPAAKPDGGDDDGPEDDYLDTQNALLAAELYGPEVTEAAQAVWELLEVASTTADYVALLEAYHAARLKGTVAGPGSTGGEAKGSETPTRGDLVRPRVDTNRDGSPDSDDRLAEARKSGKLEDFTAGVSELLGFGPSKRT